MSTPYEVPTKPENQEFDISLAGVTYHLKLRWCAPAACWMLDVEDSSQDPVATGLSLITGADLLEQLAYLVIGGQLVVQSDYNPNEVPDYGSLGSTGHLYFVTTP